MSKEKTARYSRMYNKYLTKKLTLEELKKAVYEGKTKMDEEAFESLVVELDRVTVLTRDYDKLLNHKFRVNDE